MNALMSEWFNALMSEWFNALMMNGLLMNDRMV